MTFQSHSSYPKKRTLQLFLLTALARVNRVRIDNLTRLSTYLKSVQLAIRKREKVTIEEKTQPTFVKK
jgi:hypothetical protein